MAGSAVPSLLLAVTKLVTGLGCKVQDPAAWLAATTVYLALLALDDFWPIFHSQTLVAAAGAAPGISRAVGQARPT